MAVIPSTMPVGDVRPVADHRRQRNITRLFGVLRRTSISPNYEAGLTPLGMPEDLETSVSRVKKKIKHKRMWDDQETQASEVHDTTSKRPDRIKTRRRLIPTSSTARALRTAVLQDDPYYDFGKKIKHTSSSSTVGLNILDLETRTSIKLPVIVATTEEDKDETNVPRNKLVTERNSTLRTRAQLNRNFNSTSNNFKRPENITECVYPRFTRRNKSRSQRDVRCLPDSDARTTKILSTVVTSVSVKGNQRKNDTIETRLLNSTSSNLTNEYITTISSGIVSSTIHPDPASTSPKYLRHRYRNISLPEYLEINKVNHKRLNSTIITEADRTTSTEITSTSTGSINASSFLLPIDSTEVIDISTTNYKSLTDNPSPPTDLQDFIYLNNSTSESPPDTTSNGGIEARQRRPLFRNITRLSTDHDIGVAYPDGLATSTYFLTFLAIIPLVLVIAFAFKLAIQRKKKKVFDSSEYSSEYNRSPLDFNTITSSPITTKLPRVPQHIVWDTEKTLSVSLPSNSRWEFPREKLRLQTILGQGNFGQVWKAEADDISGHEGLTRLVAVKMVKEDAASREREDLIRELSIMQHLGSHPNVVTLLGCCTEKGI